MRKAAPPGTATTLDPEGISLRVPDGSSWIPRLCGALAAHGIPVHAASATPPTLDDVFFHHTGRSIQGARPLPAAGTAATHPTTTTSGEAP
ncbi:hypothetical protein [Streptomyces sp. NPDC001389]|uniref:hypothetical protein n=1 Tax=unclassified Streptomyces TaxID=2593676 RepID=UPI0036A544C1